MKIDVIIPTYNRAETLDRAIRSVLNQSYQDFSLYVVDDGSSDSTQEILKAYSQVNLLTQENKGVSSARNLGVRKSHNPWVAFLDSDDEWLPHKLKSQVEFLQNDPSLRFLHSEEIWIRNGVRVNPKVKHNKSSSELKKSSLEFCLISPSTVMMKRDLFNEHQGFDETLEVCEDFDLWNKILATEEVGFLNNFVTQKYGGHPDQLSTKFVAMDYWRIKSLIGLLKLSHHDKDLQHRIKEIIQRKSEILLKGYLKHNNLEKHQEVLSLISSIVPKI